MHFSIAVLLIPLLAGAATAQRRTHHTCCTILDDKFFRDDILTMLTCQTYSPQSSAHYIANEGVCVEGKSAIWAANGYMIVGTMKTSPDDQDVETDTSVVVQVQIEDGSAPPSDAKLRVENLHFELLEPNLRELFSRIGPVTSVKLVYDRHDRPTGTAFVEYHSVADARLAVREFDGANAYGQPIRVTLLPLPDARPRNPFDNVEKPSRSLFERIDGGSADRSPERRDRGRGRGRRSESPRARREEIDRYVPGSRNRDRSPGRSRRGTPREAGRRPGERGGGRGGRGRRTDPDGRPLVGGRPRKTQEELDAEMNDYWGGAEKGIEEQNGQKAQNAEQGGAQDVEIDLMVE
ncbi:RNA recognition motif-containing protein 3 [Elsinoe fawcettii]|nr:RNA recognition motif-containing protein 3 [Elsinoe fawcettii]